MTDELPSPFVRDYLDALERHLSTLRADEREAVRGDILSHFAEARGAGRTEDEVAQELGSPRRLARAYLIELSALPGREGGGRMDGILRLTGLVFLASLPSLVIVTVLAAVGIAFTIAGAAVTAGGVALLAGIEPTWVKWPYPASAAFAAGGAMLVLGPAALYLLYRYSLLMARMITRVLPRRRGAR